MTIYDYETATTSQKVEEKLHNKEELLSSPPRPDGVGWKLIQVVKIDTKALYLQFFWQRKIEINENNKGTKNPQLISSDIKIIHR